MIIIQLYFSPFSKLFSNVANPREKERILIPLTVYLSLPRSVIKLLSHDDEVLH